MQSGTIKKIINDRGFGFIQDSEGKDIFFHRSALSDTGNFETLQIDQKVEFDVEKSHKGVRAVNVSLV